ncbi:hypothetical protein LRD18_01280 [Halorhodospira halochloris]|uniref:Uncharacterized protein n=1 Tax=Halorhodospira halochloris TaxID=1052 RepID=A0A120MZ26_HALHR|nr:hypothetical protein [Halorhodospira halochloris]MBK1652445.1 hypothetical protein [Halorhodospira halochloris]MCG5529504.1 hypothetical protein [Halorhodospira halochloris]MCG5547481.1 hypothetical protein [Halorhodospira halochloris]BAU56337.1 hypothetical protein HH1059_22700 [Halorhodospira halochloris]
MVDREGSSTEQLSGSGISASSSAREGGGGSANRGAAKEQLDRTLPMLAYIMLLVAPMTAGISLLFGGALAVLGLRQGGHILASHYSNMLTAIAISAAAVLIALFAWSWFVGPLVYVAWMIWVILRAVSGMASLNRSEPIAQPRSLWLGKDNG